MPALGKGLGARTALGLDATVGTAVLSLAGEDGGIGAAYAALRRLQSLAAELVELRGFEPLTSAVRLQRSPI